MLDGEGVPTRKFDGTCVMVDDDGYVWTCREVKPGKQAPPGFRLVEIDPVTGKTMGWEPYEQSSFRVQIEEAMEPWQPEPGTYELCGPEGQRQSREPYLPPTRSARNTGAPEVAPVHPAQRVPEGRLGGRCLAPPRRPQGQAQGEGFTGATTIYADIGLVAPQLAHLAEFVCSSCGMEQNNDGIWVSGDEPIFDLTDALMAAGVLAGRVDPG